MALVRLGKHVEALCAVLEDFHVSLQFLTFSLFVEWSGINALLYYGPTLIREIGLQGDTVSLVVSGGIGIVQFIAVLPAIAYIDSLGRKPLLRGQSLALRNTGRRLDSRGSLCWTLTFLAQADVSFFSSWWGCYGMFPSADCTTRCAVWT